MARMANLDKRFGWKILLLLSWTVFVCCVLYVSRMDGSPETPKENPRRLHSSRSKRFSVVSSQEGDHCAKESETKEDSQIIKSIVDKHRRVSKVPFVHCSVTSPCRNDHGQYKVDCHSSACSHFKLRLKDQNRVIASLSREELSDNIRASLAGKSITTLDDLNGHIDVYCEHPAYAFKLQLTGDIIPSSRVCTHREIPRLAGDNNNNNNNNNKTSTKSVHVVYVRFLSHWELAVRFPGLFAFLEDSSRRRRLSLMTFATHQATQWDDDQVLSVFLQGRVGPFNRTRSSLLDTVRQTGHCLRLDDLSCSRSRQQEALVSNVTSIEEVICEGQPLPHREAVLERLCQGGNLTDSEARDTLTYMLLDVHELKDAGSADTRPQVSVSILNTKDVKNADVLDASLKNLFVSLLSHPDNIVMIVSDVGNPAFLSFDQSVRLHTQASNPTFLLATGGNLSMAAYSEARRLNQSLFSMKNIHEFVKTLMGSDDQTQKQSPSDSVREEAHSCRSMNVSPPFSCLCEGQFVDYDNDTLMIGFAEFSVSIINSQLQNSPQLASYTHRTASRCSGWSGLSFSNVKVGRHHGGKKRIWMDLHLQNELSRDSTALRRAALDLWDTDKIPRAEVHFYSEENPPSSGPKSPPQGDHRLWKTLCVTGDSLDYAVTSGSHLLRRWSQERRWGNHKAIVTHVHDTCLYLLLRDFGDSVGVEAANVCRDRRYDVTLHLSLMNMISLNPLPLSVSLGHAQREFLASIVKVSYTVSTFAYKLYPDFEVSYED